MEWHSQNILYQYRFTPYFPHSTGLLDPQNARNSDPHPTSNHPRFFPVDPHFAAAPATPDVFRGHIGHGDHVGQLILHFVQQKAVAEVSDHTPGHYPTWGPPSGPSVCGISRPIPIEKTRSPGN